MNVSRAHQNTIGSHIVANSRRAQRTNVNLGSKRNARRTNRGTLDQLLPNTSSRESARSYSRRSHHSGFAIQEANRARRKNLLLLLIALAVGVLIAVMVARTAYSSNINGNILIKDDDLKAALVAPENDTDPYYTLIAGEYSDSRQGYDGPNLLVLVRVDPVNHVVTFINIPSNTEVMLPDNEYHAICESQLQGGDAGLVTTISSLTGVDIAHYVKTDAQGFCNIVDAFGGVVVDVPEEVDDPDAGDIYIPAGQQQTLNGEQALTLCRADNYSNPLDVRSSNQVNVLNALLQTMVSRNGLGSLSSLDAIKKDFKTDMKVGKLKSLLSQFDLEQGITLHADHLPGSLSVEADGTYFAVSSSGLEAMMDSVNETGNPNTTGNYQLDPSSFTIEVRNGAGIDGGATQVQNQLNSAGFRVTVTGNADSYVYDETLVVYKDEAMIPAAEQVVDALSVGRIVDASIYYEFDTDILVIIGKDWKPLN
ncbi:MAG: LCP family protein [Eggerthellaceae bacterium]|nr:LCP family protein [Eggerthellaceae bacterium]